MAKISVVIPIYNVEKYIKDCLESICNQTFKDIEIICVNDGTPDNSMKIVEKIAKKDKRIVIINKKNGGLSSARNAGIDAAKSEYIYFIDSDDCLKENALELLYNKLSNENLDTLFFDAENIYENEEDKENSFVEDSYYKRQFVYDGEYTGQQLFKALRNNNEYRASACLQINRLSLIKDNNIRFVEGIIHEDELFTINVCLLSKKASHLKECLYLRLVQGNSIMASSKYIKRSYGYFKALISAIDLISKYAEKEYLPIFKAYLNELHNSSSKYYKMMSRIEDQEDRKRQVDEFKDNLETKERLIFDLLIEKNVYQLNRIGNLEKKLKAQNSIKFLLKKRIAKYSGRIKSRFRDIWYKLTNKRFVSIIIPVYNCEDYLRECLDSLKKQTLKDIEIICIDDESTDSSYEILQEYAKEDKRFRVFQQKHSNAGNARNLGISKARGVYLLFLDSDDFFDENLCKKTYHFANFYKTDVLLFTAYRYDHQTKSIENYKTLLNTDYITPKTVYSGKDLKEHLYHITSSCPWTKLFSKKFVKKHNLQFQALPNSNDVYFVRSGLALADRIMAINEKLVYYRINAGGNTQAKKHKNPLSFIEAYKKVKGKLEEEGVFEDFYQTYMNVLVTEIVFNYNSTKTEEAKKNILDYLKKQGLKELGIEKINEDLIYAHERYKEYKEIMNIKN